MQSDQTIIRKNHMRQLYHTTELIRIKDKHITLNEVFQRETLIEVFATLDYPYLSVNTVKEFRLNTTPRNILKSPLSKLVVFLVSFV